MRRAGDLIRMRQWTRRPDAGKLTIHLVEELEGVQKRAFNRGLKKFNKTRGEKW